MPVSLRSARPGGVRTRPRSEFKEGACAHDPERLGMSALKNVMAISVLASALSMLAACGQKPASGPGGPGGAPPPAEVGVITVEPRAVGLATELPGRLAASRVAQVRARVAGVVLKRVFKEGSDVKAGQLLFQIDPA